MNPGAGADGGDITRLLHAAGAGDRAAWGRLVDLVYPELKRLARGARARGQTLGTTALVHECYLRLARAASMPGDHQHLLALAVRIMRQVLVDHARERLALKRGNGEANLAVEAIDPVDEHSFEQLAEIDAALRTLAIRQPRQAEVFECRYFGGLNDEETAAALNLSPRTVHRDWNAAREWLAGMLDPTPRPH